MPGNYVCNEVTHCNGMSAIVAAFVDRLHHLVTQFATGKWRIVSQKLPHKHVPCTARMGLHFYFQIDQETKDNRQESLVLICGRSTRFECSLKQIYHPIWIFSWAFAVSSHSLYGSAALSLHIQRADGCAKMLARFGSSSPTRLHRQIIIML